MKQWLMSARRIPRVANVQGNERSHLLTSSHRVRDQTRWLTKTHTRPCRDFVSNPFLSSGNAASTFHVSGVQTCGRAGTSAGQSKSTIKHLLSLNRVRASGDMWTVVGSACHSGRQIKRTRSSACDGGQGTGAVRFDRLPLGSWVGGLK